MSLARTLALLSAAWALVAIFDACHAPRPYGWSMDRDPLPAPPALTNAPPRCP